MVLQRIETVASAGDDDGLDVYELRIAPDGRPARPREAKVVTARPAYGKVIKGMANPVEMITPREDGRWSLRISTPRVTEWAPELIAL